jgi:OmpA-OmpF porin, OOP family
MIGTVSAATIATLPHADRKGPRDSPLLKRYEGSYIVVYERKSFGEFALPLSKLEQMKERTVQNNRRFEPREKKPLEGTYTRIVYLVPADRSPLEVVRNYEEEIRSAGGNLLYQCKEAECGGRRFAQQRGRRRVNEPRDVPVPS